MYENLLVLLLFYTLFATTVLIDNKNYRGVGHAVARFTDPVNLPLQPSSPHK